MTDERLLKTYEGLLTSEEHAHMLDGSSPAVRKERLLARVLVRTTLSRSDPDMRMHCRTPGSPSSFLGWTLPHVCITCCYLGQAWDPHL